MNPDNKLTRPQPKTHSPTSSNKLYTYKTHTTYIYIGKIVIKTQLVTLNTKSNNNNTINYCHRNLTDITLLLHKHVLFLNKQRQKSKIPRSH